MDRIEGIPPEAAQIKLLPCPFCGGLPGATKRKDESLWSHAIVVWYRVYCPNCDIQFDSEVEGESVEKWNGRVGPKPEQPKPPEEHKHESLDEALGCVECQRKARLKHEAAEYLRRIEGTAAGVKDAPEWARGTLENKRPIEQPKKPDGIERTRIMNRMRPIEQPKPLEAVLVVQIKEDGVDYTENSVRSILERGVTHEFAEMLRDEWGSVTIREREKGAK